jgi:hypothetical protein
VTDVERFAEILLEMFDRNSAERPAGWRITPYRGDDGLIFEIIARPIEPLVTIAEDDA